MINSVKTDIAAIKVEFADIKSEIKITKWMGGFIVGLVSAIFMMLLKSSAHF